MKLYLILNYKFENIDKILFQNINFKKNQSILDIGCGVGHTSYHAKKKVSVNGKVTEIDISNPLLEILRNFFLKRLVKNKNFIQSYLGKIYK